MAVRLRPRTTLPSVNRGGLLSLPGAGGVPRRANLVRGSFLPASSERSGYRRRKILLTNPAWLDMGPTKALQRAQARSRAVGQEGIAAAERRGAEKKGRETREERDALVESLLLDDPQTFIDRKWPAATVKKMDLSNMGVEKGSPKHKELLQMLGEDPPLRSKAEANLKRGTITSKKLVDYGIRKGFFERDPLEVAQAKARASKTGKGLSSLLPKVSDYNTGINAWAKKYKVKAGLGLGVDEDGSLSMDMDAFTRGEQTFYEIMQGISDGSITDRKIPQDEATRDLKTIRGFYEGIRSRLDMEGTPVLPLPGAGAPGVQGETVPGQGAALETAAPAAAPGEAPGRTPGFRDMPPEERRADPNYQAYRSARISGATHEDALAVLQGGAPGAAPTAAAPAVAPGNDALAGGRAAQPTRPSPAFPTSPPNQNTQDPGVVSEMIDEMMAGAGLAANTPIDIGGGETVSLAEVAEVVKENAAMIPGFLVEFFIRNPIEGAKQIVKEMTGSHQEMVLPRGLS